MFVFKSVFVFGFVLFFAAHPVEQNLVVFLLGINSIPH